jgi:coenzyme F420-0:L-glutamate ligase/coenzyme F420-1:gamma-L-glutamate ligase
VLSATPLAGVPEIKPGDDLGQLIVAALRCESPPLTHGDVLVVAHKVVSKAEGRIRAFAEVQPGDRATALAAKLDKDPRHVQVILDESQEVLRADHGVLICVTRHGFVCANAGVDASNVPGSGKVVLLPIDPDASARGLRQRIAELTGHAPGIVITDSFGRAWRNGQSDIAVGCAGVRPLDDWRGLPDTVGRELRATVIAVADQLAGAADLARAKDRSQPVVLVRGADRYVTVDDGPGAAALIRPKSQDLFR